ncbi:hypothetical protein DL93DRAFT_2084508 [Clavulina sp. PMI_390]|nr:hypothetical protein DL93DRAFT_2084508 [Clavulina sp. PMI_390]
MGSMPPPPANGNFVEDADPTEPQRGELRSSPVATSWSELSSPFSHKHLPLAPMDRKIPSSRSPTKLDIFAYGFQLGDTQLLSSLICLTPLQGFVLSDVRGSSVDPKVVHKPLFIRNGNQESGITPLRQNDLTGWRFQWSESGGIIVAITDHRASGTYKTQIYQL